ncbi:hypothetical protein [Nitrogeniibacter aestuarii]|uniref:hypothetical protein n=1 Tax=Nitrogeniibacter aestuarii TaxID=2815343 RepID=UPI001E5D6393|nr:hypothetical protein [Nitrogeniibacter aestuarii]
MFWFLCSLWPYLAGGLVAWLVCGRMAHKLKYQPPPRERVVEKVVEKIVEVDSSALTESDFPLGAVSGTDADVATALSESRAYAAALEAELSALRAGPLLDTTQAAAAGFSLDTYADADDLTVITGIDAKICEVLHAAGVRRFSDLARVDATQLLDMLKVAGDPVAHARLSTWPAQAALAAHNHWVALKAWQDVLDGGEEEQS